MNRAAALKLQDTTDAPAYAAIKNDYDAHGFFQTCGLHPEHPAHPFLTYCVVCPEDHGNGKASKAAREAARAALIADYPEMPF